MSHRLPVLVPTNEKGRITLVTRPNFDLWDACCSLGRPGAPAVGARFPRRGGLQGAETLSMQALFVCQGGQTRTPQPMHGIKVEDIPREDVKIPVQTRRHHMMYMIIMYNYNIYIYVYMYNI